VADEAVLLNLSDQHYYGLDEVGARIWTLLLEHGDIEVVIQQMLREYEVNEATLRRDLMALIQEMEQRGILQSVQE
jgi:DeoR/GlpR family transcriptional regulator of sugar metabolism